MDGEDIAPNTCLQLIQSVWAESRACTLYWNIVYWRDFLPIPTLSAGCIWRNTLVVHSAVLSIYKTYLSMGRPKG